MRVLGGLNRIREEGGFTLVELLVVMSILAVLAAVVIPTVTGVNTSARNVAQPNDLSNIQTSITNFNADSGNWPTRAPYSGSAWAAGARPTVAYSVTAGAIVTFTVNSIANLNWDASQSVAGTTKVFFPDYVGSKPKHVSDTITVNAGATAGPYIVIKGATTYTVTVLNDTGAAITYNPWGIDRNGQVWTFVDKDSY